MKKKLNLNDLKVNSFVTNFDEVNLETVKGGLSGWRCDLNPIEKTQNCLATIIQKGCRSHIIDFCSGL